MLKFRAALTFLVAILIAGGAAAVPVVLTFDDIGLSHGSMVSTQYAGVTITADNDGGGPDFAVAFNSALSGTHDPDLEAGNNPWSAGNLAGTSEGNLGFMLIIQENSRGCLADMICDDPDDEGSRPAGSLIFDFDTAVLDFGFAIVDVEDTTAEDGSITFHDGANSVSISMMVFLSGFTLGDNSANTVPSFVAGVGALANLTQFDKVEINLGGSGAIDNVKFDVVPEPATAALLGFGLVGLAARSRRR